MARPAPRNKSRSQGSLGPGLEMATEMEGVLGHARHRDGLEGGRVDREGAMLHPA